MRPMIDSYLPSITDTRYCLVSEIQRSMNERLEITKLENKKDLSKVEAIRLKRRKRNDDLIGLEQSVVLSEIHYLYFEKKHFRAGIYHDELRTDDYFIRNKEGVLKVPLTSGQKWKKHDEYSEIKKYKQVENGSEEREVALILYELLGMAEKTNIPPLQKVIDHAMANTDEQVRKEIFARTLNINLTRHIKDWSELRENSRKELLHHSFRTRLEKTLQELAWIKTSEEEETIYYFYSEDSEYLLDANGPNDGIGFRRQQQQLLTKLKKFHGDIQGYNSEYFIALQDLDENSEKKVNAPQIFRTDVLEEKLFPFLFKEENLILSLQDIYKLLSEFLERYIGGLTKKVSDNYVSDDGDENLLSDKFALEENLPNMDENLLRKDIHSKIKDLDPNVQKKLSVVCTIHFIKDRFEYHKNALQRELTSKEINNFALIIKTDDNSQNFSPIGMNMRVNRIDELIEEEVIKEYFLIEDDMGDLISQMDSYLDPIVAKYPESEKENILREVFDIFIESTMDNLYVELKEVA